MPQTVGITVPWGAKEGDKLKASTDDGRMFSVRVPSKFRLHLFSKTHLCETKLNPRFVCYN